GYLNYSHPGLCGMMNLPDEEPEDAEDAGQEPENIDAEGGEAEAGEEQAMNLAWADLTLVRQCLKAAADLGVSNTVGSTRSHDALYLPIKGKLDEFYSSQGVSASDMETAALFAVGEARGVRTCSILNVVVEWKKDLKEGISSYKGGEDKAAEGEKNEILVALEALAAAGE
nr:hypothetical protein [Lachnospiraceae bacterium]